MTTDAPDDPDRADGTDGTDDPEVAMGAETLLGDTRAAQAHGYDEQFVARDDGDVDCGGCRRAVNPVSLRVDHLRRLEGASDAADLLVSAWCRCPICGAHGVLTLGYGPNATGADQRVLTHLPTEGADSSPVEAAPDPQPGD